LFQPLDRVAIALIAVLGLLTALVLFQSDTVAPRVRDFSWQKVKVQGFVIHPPELPPEYLLLSRFVITCCAADAYPVGLPVKLTQNRQAYPQDAWLEVEGEMITQDLQNKRQLTIQATNLRPIQEPKNPYEY
jgi:uncharacterized repeat protein (TIGR03943 family)